MSHTIRIGILVFPESVGVSAAGPHDVFRIANTLSQLRPAAEQVRFDVQWVSREGGPVTNQSGISFATHPLGPGHDALIVSAIDRHAMREVVPAIRAMPADVEMVRGFAASGRFVAAMCTGTFLLAEAGVLDQRRATTSWWLVGYFAKHYPNVALESGELVVQDGHILTSGGASSYLDLALWLVGRFGGESLRKMTAKVLVADSGRASQTPYVSQALVERKGHAVIELARRWLNDHIDQDWSMADLAAHCNTSPRTLLRRFQKALGVSPVQYAQQLRVERAKALLESSMLSLEDITSRCGYADVSTFSTVFKRWAQVTPREYRTRFGMRS
jgi:transcriptional regulator GlxA family with amidase domain